jgi:trimethylamine-N-oxide reductase (cytochrome c)
MHLWRPERAECGYRTSQLAQGPSAHTVLVEVERYQQKAPQVTAFGGPQIVKEEGTSAA